MNYSRLLSQPLAETISIRSCLEAIEKGIFVEMRKFITAEIGVNKTKTHSDTMLEK